MEAPYSRLVPHAKKPFAKSAVLYLTNDDFYLMKPSLDAVSTDSLSHADFKQRVTGELCSQHVSD